MRVGRIETNGTKEFVVSNDGENWLKVADIGTSAGDTRELIQRWPMLDATRNSEAVVLDEGSRLVNPVVRPGKIVAIGLNYMDHIRETEAQKPDRLVAFAKYSSSLIGPYEDVEVDPDLTSEADYEAELAVIVGVPARRVLAPDAMSHVFGYCVANDVSARDEQTADSQFSRSKSMDTFCPIGPWITTADEIEDPQNLGIRSWVNGEPRQNSTTGEMLFSVADIIEYLSRTMTLETGDVILTGTPHGVGFGYRPPRFLKPNDVVRCEVEGLGFIQNRIVSP